ncbi:hypothetical protein A7E78_07915 [Syntrophotalea acetylenivorans]|uniref:Pyridoxamine 5'-phosphate oxidase N-terminal domain-containing protein n=1 Tax=Syntrophotalea acetylenivorans TaxID=1842532 RepID=A0A1L3GPA5_9BACT|nr:pyridoxamine 5'-phosphate oxidase family protein [Syntrophotalea acetylenivorans]APG27767.1 hypothetical protein A7E78_07915 [Syntrophotalea acetylenivorans]
MTTVYHRGEIDIQKQAGARKLAASMERTVLPVISHRYVDFIHSQSLLVLASVGDQGQVWASLLCGPAGFMAVEDEQTLRVEALPKSSDPLQQNLYDNSEVGLLLIDFVTRRRLRINGTVRMRKGGFAVHTRQVYANCPRYIQARECELRQDAPAAATVRQMTSLNDEIIQQVSQVDTFFIASFHPQSGADVSHRGGFPGFVQATDEQALLWPEYNGNGMFNTLGNLRENPQAGLLFIDFDQGDILQLSGTATIISDPERAAAIPGAERLVEFKIHSVIEARHATPLRGRFTGYSPDNPWFC